MEIPPTITNTHDYFQKVLPCFYKGSQKGDSRWFNPQHPAVLIWRGENSELGGITVNSDLLSITKTSGKQLQNSFLHENHFLLPFLFSKLYTQYYRDLKTCTCICRGQTILWPDNVIFSFRGCAWDTGTTIFSEGIDARKSCLSSVGFSLADTVFKGFGCPFYHSFTEQVHPHFFGCKMSWFPAGRFSYWKQEMSLSAGLFSNIFKLCSQIMKDGSF